MSIQTQDVADFTDEDYKQIAIGIVSGSIFTNLSIDENTSIAQIFMPLVFMEKDVLDELINSDVGLIYEHLSAAAPMGVNGMPCFFSMRILTIDQTTKVFDYIEKLKSL